MNEIAKLHQIIAGLEVRIASLELKMSHQTEFQDTFSGRTVINHEVQFKQRVYDKEGGVVTEINP